MSNNNKNGAVSKDFPLYHSDRIPVYIPQENIHHTKNFSKIRITYSNEHPDIFRLKGMREGGYINPHLKNIEGVDREEYIKKIDNSKNKIHLIDLLKSSRKYSQDPKLLRLIKNDYYVRRKKIESIIPDNALSSRNYYSLSSDNRNIFNKALKKLNQDSEKVAKDFLKRNLDLNKVEKIGDNFLISKDDVNKLKKISCPFDINNSSSYIGNYNDYKISESQKKDINKEFNYQRKPLLIYNPIINKNKVLYPPPYKFSKWGAFSQNHFILSNIKNGFNKKGGLFSEFVKKNIDKLNVMKRDVIEKLKKEKENNKIQKEKNLDNMSYNNLNSYENYAINNLKYHSLSPSNSMKNMLIGRKLKEMFSHF